MMMKDKLVNGPQNAAHRSLYHALGLTPEEQQRPLIAVAHSSVLAWRIPGTGEPGGLPSMGSHRVGHD